MRRVKKSLSLQSLSGNRGKHIGEMAEWSNAAVLKTVDLHGSGGSNPSLSAKVQKKAAELVRAAFFSCALALPRRRRAGISERSDEIPERHVTVIPTEHDEWRNLLPPLRLRTASSAQDDVASRLRDTK